MYICNFGSPDEVRERARKLIDGLKQYEDNNPPMKTYKEIDGEVRLLFSLNAVRKFSEALINTSDDMILATRGKDIAEVMDMFVFNH